MSGVKKGKTLRKPLVNQLYISASLARGKHQLIQMLKFLNSCTKKCKNVSYCFHDTNYIFIHEVACVASKYQIYCICMFHPGCNSSCFKVLSLVDGKIIAMNIVDNWSVVWIIRNEWKKTINQLVGAWFSTCAFWGFLFFLSLSSSLHLFWMNLFM